MAIDNLYNSLSKFSIGSILHRFLFDSKPDVVQLYDKPYEIYPLGIKSGLLFYNQMCSSIFSNLQIKFFENTANVASINQSFFNLEFVDELFRLINDLYTLDSTDELYNLLQKSNLKQIRYLLYIIKKQNFTYWDTNRYNANSYDMVITTIDRLEAIMHDFKKQSDIATIVDVDAIEYNSITTDTIKLDYTTKFYKDYIIGNDGFYAIIANGYINKFIGLAERIPSIINTDDPQIWCKINNDKCIQSCRFFDPACVKRFVKNYSYFPFKSIYILPQLIALFRSTSRESDLDNLIRGVMYGIYASMGTDTRKIKGLCTIDHNESIAPLLDKNRLNIVKSLFNKMNFTEIENEVRTSLGLNENKADSFENLHATLVKIYNFIEGNKTAFIAGDETRLEIITDFLEMDFHSLIILNDYTTSDFSISSFDDYTNYVIGLSDKILHLDNMLMQFPNDLKNLDNMVTSLMKMIKQAKQEAGKVGQKTVIDSRETLLTSESVLHRRIAVDDALYSFYKENNRTKVVNSVLFWKFSIALFYVAEIFLHLDENSAVQNINFNVL